MKRYFDFIRLSQTILKPIEFLKISQLELALTIGMKSGAFFGNAENNTHDKHFNIEHIYKIAKALDVPMVSLFDDVE